MTIKLVLHPILASLAQIWAQKMFFENFTFYYMLDIVASYHCLEFYASYCMRTLLQAIIVIVCDQEASPSAFKNTGVVLVPCLHMEVRPYSYFRWCGYF